MASPESQQCDCGQQHDHDHSQTHAHDPGRKQPAGPPATPPSLAKVKHIVAVASGKGGVGKTTVAVNLAYALAAQGARVGILDTDVYGPSVPGMVGQADHSLTGANTTPDGKLKPVEAHGMKIMSLGFMTTRETPVIWRGPMASQLVQQFLGGVEWGELDYLFIDLPPGTGDIQLTLSQAVPLSGAVIITTPQEVAQTIAEKGLRMFQTVQVPILGIVENMSYYHCPECGHNDQVFCEGGGEKAATSLNLPLLGSIPLNGEIARASDSGVPLLAIDKDSELSRIYLELAGKVTEQLEAQAVLEAENPVAPTKARVTEEGLFQVQWQDGSESSLTPRALRQACPCASCVEEFSGKPLLDPASVPVDITLKGVAPVGRYALSFEFSDGHKSGIYNFDHLRKLGREKQAGKQGEEFEV